MFTEIYNSFQKAFYHAFYVLLSLLKNYAPTWFYNFVLSKVFPSTASLCDAFKKAASSGQVGVMRFLREVACGFSCHKTMLSFGEYEAFCLAAQNWRYKAMEFIYQEVSQIGDFPRMLSHMMNNKQRWSTEQNYDLFVAFLWDKKREMDTQETLFSDHRVFFTNAIFDGNIHLTKFLYRKALEQAYETRMFAALNNHIFRLACGTGHMGIVQFLWDKSVEQKRQKEMLAAEDYRAFGLASHTGYLNVVQFLWDKSVEQNCQEEMLAAEDYRAFGLASHKGHLDVVQFLKGVASPQQLGAMKSCMNNKWKPNLDPGQSVTTMTTRTALLLSESNSIEDRNRISLPKSTQDCTA